MRPRKILLPIVIALGMSTSADVPACASCGCTLSADWENLSLSRSSGLKIDLRYDYLNQNELRSGTGTISAAAASQIVHQGEPQEVERYTRNQYLTATIDYSATPAWGIDLQIPYVFRNHSTLGTASNGSIPGAGGGQYDSDTSNLGDLKLISRFQGFNARHNFGLLFGLKFPTGSHTETGTSTDPTAPDPVPIDRGLQPGTGSTDIIAGAYYTDALDKNWDYFLQGLYQTAIATQDDYRPGDGVNLNAGIRFLDFKNLIPQMQLNARHVEHDSGGNADLFSTGGTLLYLSPGVVVPVTRKASVYGFVQVPLFQDVRGVQLAPEYTVSIGVRMSF